MARIETPELALLISGYLIRCGDFYAGLDALHRLACHWAAWVSAGSARTFQESYYRQHYHTQYELDHHIVWSLPPLELRNLLFFSAMGSVLAGIRDCDQSMLGQAHKLTDSDEQLKIAVKSVAIETMLTSLQIGALQWMEYLLTSQIETLKRDAEEVKMPPDPVSYVYLFISESYENGGFKSEADVKYWKGIDIRIIW